MINASRRIAAFAKSRLPSFLRDILSDIRIDYIYLRENLLALKDRDPKIVFSKIYSNKVWGSLVEENCGSSGSGSNSDLITRPYIDLVQDLSHKEGFEGTRFVDLGCGDFNVGKSIAHLSSKYIGADIVEEIIYRNQARYSSSKIEFMLLDLISDPLPKGDVCFLRQVLQHLSNEHIQAIINKLEIYKWVFITEHYPLPSNLLAPNIDKRTGASTRLVSRSGVYLDEPPFSINRKQLTQVLEVPDGCRGKYRGVIKTFLYKPQLQ